LYLVKKTFKKTKIKGKMPTDQSFIADILNSLHTIVGVDFGQTWFAAFIKKTNGQCFKQTFKMKVLSSFLHKALQQPTRHYLHWLKEKKELHATDGSFPQISHVSNDPYMPSNMNDIYQLERALEKHEDEDWISFKTRHQVMNQSLEPFYNSNEMKKRKNYLKKALRYLFKVTLLEGKWILPLTSS
jgi:hypothetical protein